MAPFDERLAQRQKAFKRGIVAEDGRRKLEDAAVQIRKQRREEVVHKKRLAHAAGDGVTVPMGDSNEHRGQAMSWVGLPQLQQLAHQMQSQDVEAQRQAVQTVSELLFAEWNVSLAEVVNSGVLSSLVQLLSQGDNRQLQLECAWTLTNITSGTPEQTRAVVEAGAVPVFLKLLKVQNDELREQALWALGNIAGDSAELRDFLLTSTLPHENLPATAAGTATRATAATAAAATPSSSSRFAPPARSSPAPTINVTLGARTGTGLVGNRPGGGGGSGPGGLVGTGPGLVGTGPGMGTGAGRRSELLSLLLLLLRDCDTTEILRTSTWVLSTLCRGHPLAPFDLVTPALGALSNLCYSTDEEVLTEACWALADMAEDPERRPAILQAGVCRRIVELLSHDSATVQAAALRGAGNIVAGDGPQTQVLLQCGVLLPLKALIQHSVKAIRREACWAISNVAAGTPEQIQQIYHAQLLPLLIQTLANDLAFDVRMEALWSFANIVRGGRIDQVEHLSNSGCIQPLVSMLAVQDVRCWQVVMDTLNVLLQVGTVRMHQSGGNSNPVARAVEEAGGFHLMEERLYTLDSDTYAKVEHVLGQYHQSEDHDDELAMSVGSEPSGSCGHHGRFDFI